MSSGLDENQLDSIDKKLELYDINCHFNDDNSYHFADQDKWEGQFILHEDGWFEGMLNDKDTYILGIYSKDNIIELLKVNPSFMNYSQIYRGNLYSINYCEKQKSNYLGMHGKMNPNNEELVGNCSFSIKEAEKQNTKVLKSRIKSFKEKNYELLKKINILYKNNLLRRKNLIELLNTMYGEETFRIISQMSEINSSLDESTVDRLLTRVKYFKRKKI